MTRSCNQTTLRAELAAMHHDGHTYIKARDVARRTEWDAYQVGAHLPHLTGENDILTRWSDGGNATVYRIDL